MTTLACCGIRRQRVATEVRAGNGACALGHVPSDRRAALRAPRSGGRGRAAPHHQRPVRAAGLLLEAAAVLEQTGPRRAQPRPVGAATRQAPPAGSRATAVGRASTSRRRPVDQPRGEVGVDGREQQRGGDGVQAGRVDAHRQAGGTSRWYGCAAWSSSAIYSSGSAYGCATSWMPAGSATTGKPGVPHLLRPGRTRGGDDGQLAGARPGRRVGGLRRLERRVERAVGDDVAPRGQVLCAEATGCDVVGVAAGSRPRTARGPPRRSACSRPRQRDSARWGRSRPPPPTPCRLSSWSGRPAT